MSDQELRAAFEQTSLPESEFDHEAHVRMAWIYLRQYSLPEAIARFTTDLKRYTRALGAEDKYHETITWFFLVLIHDRMAESGEQSWDEFRLVHPDLISSAPALLSAHYSKERLTSGAARSRFLLPDRGG